MWLLLVIYFSNIIRWSKILEGYFSDGILMEEELYDPCFSLFFLGKWDHNVPYSEGIYRTVNEL